MRYQLVFQFSREAFDNLDGVTELEAMLRSILGDSAIVDGHDIGLSKVKIFIDTHNPSDSFARCKYVLNYSNFLSQLTVVFRQHDRQDYTVIWPEGCQQSL